MGPEPRFIGTWSSDPLVLVPPTPAPDVCAVYDVTKVYFWHNYPEIKSAL